MRRFSPKVCAMVFGRNITHEVTELRPSNNATDERGLMNTPLVCLGGSVHWHDYDERKAEELPTKIRSRRERLGVMMPGSERAQKREPGRVVHLSEHELVNSLEYAEVERVNRLREIKDDETGLPRVDVLKRQRAGNAEGNFLP